jgi:hypothetical protein
MFVDFNILNQLGSPSINSNTFANRPAAGQTGRLFVSTDTFEIFRDNGTGWDLIGGPGAGTITGTGTATQVAYFTGAQTIGSSANLFWDNTAGALGINTATPGAELDIHGTGIIVQVNSTSATANSLLAFQRSGSGVWRIGDQYNGGSNFFELHNTVLTNNAIEVTAANNKSTFTALETYASGLATGNQFTYNLTVPNGVNITSPNAVGGVNSYLNLSLGGNTTVPVGARQGLEGNSRISFTGAGTLTMTQGSTVRAFSALSSVYSFAGSAVGTVTHLAGLRICFPDNLGSAINITNNYGLLLNDQTTGLGTVTYTNRWGVYQEGSSDLNYFNGNLLVKTTTNAGFALDVTGGARATTGVSAGTTVLAAFGQATRSEDGVTNNNYFSTAQDIIFSSNRFRSNFLSPSNRLVLSTQNIANRTVALLFGIDALQLDAGITLDNNTRTVSLINSTGNSNSSTYTPRLNVFTSGNVAINSTTDAGFKLDCNGTARFSNTVDTTNLTITNTNGRVTFNNSITQGGVLCSNTSGLRLSGGPGGAGTNYSAISLFTGGDLSGGNITATGGTIQFVRVGESISGQQIAPTSGTLSVTGLNISLGINTTGTYSGIIRGLLFSPIIVSSTGADIRAIETVVGNTLLGTTSGSTSIGATTTINASAQLQVVSTTKGFLPPVMTGAQAEAIGTPAAGLMVYANNGNGVTITTTGWWGYDGATWVKLN